MQTEHFVNLVQKDWTIHNLQVLKHCINSADADVLERTADYPPTKHHSVVQGIIRWDRLDHHLDMAAHSGLFEDITSRWVEYQGQPILELVGQYTCLTVCHILTRDDKPRESEYSYRKNNRAKNQKNPLLFKELDEPASDDDKPQIVLVHGGLGNDRFAYLRIFLENSDIPDLTENLMLLPELEAMPNEEIVPTPMPELNKNLVAPKSEPSPESKANKTKNVHS